MAWAGASNPKRLAPAKEPDDPRGEPPSLDAVQAVARIVAVEDVFTAVESTTPTRHPIRLPGNRSVGRSAKIRVQSFHAAA